ncbi:MAG: Hsp33 family molecular chaperone HslO [Lachnospiraceae bacterium]|jgi:molecular chaperone Hsp33|nr:Hsp33 family molecular chaperone HslO [Lachnospiraceae bacterium]
MVTEDYVVRAAAAGSQVRAFAAASKGMVEEARSAHNTSPVVTAALGRLLTAGAMMGAMQKGDKDMLTLQIQSEGPVKGLMVTADSHGNVKGYAFQPDVRIPANAQGKLDVASAVGPGFLHVVKDMGLKEPYRGQIELQSGEVAEDLTYYFAASEQTPSSVGLGVLMNRENTVRQAGGFIIQLMPDTEDDIIRQLESNIRGLRPVTEMLDAGFTPEQMLETVLAGLDVEMLEQTPCRFFCNCDRDRIEKALISVGRKELQDMIQEDKEIEVNCHFCGRHYIFTPAELKELLQQCTR